MVVEIANPEATVTVLDARGLKCPMPIVKTALQIKGMSSGQLLEVMTTDPGSLADFAAWSRSTGHELVRESIEDAVYHFVIRHK
jgi:tRNA 2-thiouridine synthesizing protein A